MAPFRGREDDPSADSGRTGRAGCGSIEGLEGMKKSMVFQEDRLCENLSAAANIRLVRQKKPWGKDPKEVREIREAMRAAGLSGCEDQPVRSFREA